MQVILILIWWQTFEAPFENLKCKTINFSPPPVHRGAVYTFSAIGFLLLARTLIMITRLYFIVCINSFVSPRRFTGPGKRWPAVTSCLWSTSSCSSVKSATTRTCSTRDPSSRPSSPSPSFSTRPPWCRTPWRSSLWRLAAKEIPLVINIIIIISIYLTLCVCVLSAATFLCLTLLVWRAGCPGTRQMFSCHATKSAAN